LPGVGQDVKAAPQLLEGVIDLTEAGQMALDAIGSVWPAQAEDIQSIGMTLFDSLEQVRPQLDAAQASFTQAAEHLRSVDASELSPDLARQVERVTAVLPLVQSGFALIEAAPDILGLQRPKTYIILLQNSDELRPTGGFITAVARLRLDQGQIVDLEVRDNAVDDYLHKPYASPPQPLREFMGSELWLFRDANWSPDFPTSARKAAELYTYGTGIEVDGVIGLNQRVVTAIMNSLGSVEVEPGLPPVDASNIIAYMYESWSPPPGEEDVGAWAAQRKDFIGRLMNAILARLGTSPDQIRWAALGRGLLDSLSSHDLMLWIDNGQASSILTERGWDGAVWQGQTDYWMLVDSNVGFNKANAVVESSVSYTVTLDRDGSAEAILAAHYAHTGRPASGCVHQIPYSLSISYETLIQACYWDFVRLYVPQGAQLQTATSHPVPEDYLVLRRPSDGVTQVDSELGKTVFGTLFVVERGQSLEYSVSYHLPAVSSWTPDGGNYMLTVQKQSGTPPHRAISVTLAWPDGYVPWRASLPSVHNPDGSLTFSFDLATDTTLSVEWRRE